MAKDKQRNVKILLGLGILILGIWYTCGFGGPKPWAIDLTSSLGMNACPSNCWAVNNSNDGNATQTSTCPPLYTKMHNADPTLINAGVSACLTIPGTSTRTDYEVSCRTGTGAIDCDALATNYQNAKFAYLAHINGAAYRCQDNFVGAYCIGSLLLPEPGECGKIISWDNFNSQWTAQCGGPCASGKTCQATEAGCQCVSDTPVYTCAGNPVMVDGIGTCSWGTCPPGEFCLYHDAPLNGNAYCGCEEPV